MKRIFIIIGLNLCFSCASQLNWSIDKNSSSAFENGFVKISNPEIEYEVIIFDVGFESWYRTHAKQRGFYSQSHLELKNRIWVMNFNSLAKLPNSNIQYTIDYDGTTDYGYEVNYMLYNYLTYFQETNRIRLD